MAVGTLRRATAADLAAWDELAAGAHGHLDQASWWVAPLHDYGVEHEVIGRWVDGELVGGALFRFARVPYAGVSVGDCLAGPLGDLGPPDEVAAFVDAVARLARRRRAVQVSFRNAPSADLHRSLTAALDARGARWRAHPEPAAAVIPLAGRSLDDVIAGFRQNARRFMRKGQAGPLVVRTVTERSELRQAHQAWESTAERKGFSELRPWGAAEPVLVRSAELGVGSVFGAFLGDRLVAAIFVTFAGGEALYVYGGFHVDAADLYPNHILHVAAIEAALERGLGSYNLGLLGVTAATKGVVAFKTSLGAQPRPLLDGIEWDTIPALASGVRVIRTQRAGKQVIRWARSVAVRRGDRASRAR